MFSLAINAQKSITVSGVVKDEQGYPISDALVLLEGTKKGAVTDINGNFMTTLKVTNTSRAYLVFSALGYQEQKMLIQNQRIFNVVLNSEIKLDDLVVTSSYGTSKLKEEVVGSISTLNSDDILVGQSLETVEKMFDGQIAGLNVQETSEIGTPTEINIRGLGTLDSNNSLIGTSNQPLIIVDGVILKEDRGVDQALFNGVTNFGEDFLNPLARIAPENIESINVLKDAAAVGFYGANAANGVIIITTKKVEKNQLSFNAGVNTIVSTAMNKTKYLNGPQYNQLYNTYLRNSNSSEIPYNGVDVDWFEVLNKVSSSTRATFSTFYSKKKLNLSAGINYYDLNEAKVGNNYSKLGANLNVGLRFNRLKFQLNNNFVNVDKRAPNQYFNFILAPTFPIYDEEGNYSLTGIEGIANPLAAIDQNYFKNDEKSYLGSYTVNYKFSHAWEWNALLGIDYSEKRDIKWFSGENESGRQNASFTVGNTIYRVNGRSIEYLKKFNNWNASTNLKYKYSGSDKHFFDAFLGIEAVQNKSYNQRYYGLGYIDYTYYRKPQEADDKFQYNAATNEVKSISFFTQLNYNFSKKYYLSLTMRRDENSNFGKNTQVAYNGGLGASWVVSKEPFFDSEFFTFLRLRTSWGLTGNSRIGSYNSVGIYNSNNNGYNGQDYATQTSLENPNLGWEKNDKFNLGFDVEIKDRINLTLELFRDNRSDLIVKRSIPIESGFSDAQINGASMYNKGLELTLNAKILEKNAFRWNTILTYTTIKNKITKISGFGSAASISSKLLSQRIGHSTSTLWGYDWIGVDPATGRNLYNVNGQIYDGASLNDFTNTANLNPIGNTQPKFYGGWTNTLIWKDRLSMNVMFNYKIGQDVLVDNELIDQYRVLTNRNMTVNALNHWSFVGDDKAQHPVVDRYNNVTKNTSQYIYDGSHLKLQNIQLNYLLKGQDLNSPWLGNLQITMGVTNVGYFYLAKSPKGGNGIKELRFSYPEMRSINMGISANF